MKDVVDKVLRWLRDVLPTVTAVGSWIYNYMLRRINKIEKEKAALELELEYKENKDAIEKNNAGKSDRDIILDIAGKGDSSRNNPE